MTHTPNLALPAQPPARTLLALSALALVASLAACSSTPTRNVALDEARSRYAAAQTQPGVSTLATDELKRAGDALRAAEKAKADDEALSTVDHLSYLANQRVTIALDTAASRSAQAVTAGAAAERDRIRLAERTAEADAAKVQLAASQQSANSAAQALASSRQNNAAQSAQLLQAAKGAEVDQDRLARRNAQVDDLQAQLRELNARQTERGLVVTLGDVLFASGQSALQPGGTRVITQLAEFLKRNPQRTAAIEGYTDSVGSEASNQALSDRRARTVMQALVDEGVPRSRLNSVGRGESMPVAVNDTADGRRANRRVEIVFAPDAGDVVLK